MLDRHPAICISPLPMKRSVAFALFWISIHAWKTDAAQPSPLLEDRLAEATKNHDAAQGLDVLPTQDGVLLQARLQKLSGHATQEGLWVGSTIGTCRERLRLRAIQIGPDQQLPLTGEVRSDLAQATWLRPGLVEEYRAGVHGIRQDFLVLERPAGGGGLEVTLELHGAQAQPCGQGAQMRLPGSGRILHYHRLHVTDATGRELKASLRVPSAERLVISVEDAGAAYPVRIDPTFSDADWTSLGGLPGVGDADLGTGGAQVNAMAMDNQGNLYVGGKFTAAGETAAVALAKWDGSSWSTVDFGASGGFSEVTALLHDRGHLYVSGTGQVEEHGVVSRNIAAWDGSTWTGFGTGLSQPAGALLFFQGRLFAANGRSTAPFSTPYDAPSALASWDGNTWHCLGEVEGQVHAMAGTQFNLYLGGNFQKAGNFLNVFNLVRYDVTDQSWHRLESGIVDLFGVHGIVYALAVLGNQVIVGGDFTRLTSVGRIYGMAAWDGQAWSQLGAGLSHDAANEVKALAVSGNQLYMSGNFTAAGGTQACQMAHWNGNEWRVMGMTSPSDFYSETHCLLANGPHVFVGGDFDEIRPQGTPIQASCVAQWNGTSWSALTSGYGFRANEVGSIQTEIFDLESFQGCLYAAGWFQNVNGQIIRGIACWDGITWSQVGGGLAGSAAELYVQHLAVFQGRLYAFGNFEQAGDVMCEGFASWDGESWAAARAGLPEGSQPTGVMAAGPGHLYLTAFATGDDGEKIYRWDGTSCEMLGQVQGTVRVLAVDGSHLYAGGDFTSMGGVQARHIAMWDGARWQSLGAGIESSTTSDPILAPVMALTIANGALYAAGSFTQAGNVAAANLARWDGQEWSAAGTGLLNMLNVRALAWHEGLLFAGGVGNNTGTSSALRVWDGSQWTELSPNKGYLLCLHHEGGKLYLGGNFARVGNQISHHVAALDLADDSSGTPELVVEQPEGRALTSGGAAVAFGITEMDAAGSRRMFTLRNTGYGSLRGLSVASSPDGQASEFILNTAGMTSTLRAGAATNFSVTFKPGVRSQRTSTLILTSRGDVQDPFVIPLIGTGQDTLPPTGGLVEISDTGPVTRTPMKLVFSGWEDASQPLVYSLTITGAPPGIQVQGNGPVLTFDAPEEAGDYALTALVSDAAGNGVTVLNMPLTIQTAQGAFAEALAAAGLSGDAAASQAVPFADGVPNLLKYASNMNLAGFDNQILSQGGSFGLPLIIARMQEDGSSVFRFEYLRRKGSGLIYTPEQSTNLQAPESWQPLTSQPEVVPIDMRWERVIHEEPCERSRIRSFGRVKVSLP